MKEIADMYDEHWERTHDERATAILVLADVIQAKQFIPALFGPNLAQSIADTLGEQTLTVKLEADNGGNNN
jgi:hypothetical protein